MIKKLILSTLLLCGLANAAPSSTLDAVLERGVLRVGFDAGYQPFEMTNKQGQYIGFDVDLAKMVAKEMGVKVEFVNTAWDGIIPALLTDKFDVIMGGMTVTPQRNLRVNFADPYIVVGQTIVLRKDKAGEIKSFSDLNDPKYKIAVKLGTDHVRQVRKDCASVILWCAEKATWMAGEGVQIFGGNGYINEYPLGRLWRDAKLYEIGAGTSEIRRMLIGRELFAETC